MVNFVLDYLSSSVSMDVSGIVYSQTITAVDASATAVVYVSLAAVQEVFKFQTTSDFDIENLPSDIRYQVNHASWPALNPANSMMDDALSLRPIITGDSKGAFNANDMLVAHDFVRYLALELFNSAYGADLFDNQKALLNDIRAICGSTEAGQTWFDIVAKLKAVSADSTEAGLESDPSGNKYLTDSTTGESNVCRTLFQQLTGPGGDINRFSTIQGGDGYQSLPLEADDSISFKLTIAAAPGQHNLTGVEPIAPRSYEIKMIMVADTTDKNTEVSADEL
jgi:hypothetical protein